MWIYPVLDFAFLLFHSLLILLNLFGWIFAKTRKLQRVSLVLTLFSWFILGFIYGWGYCVLTDLHWDVLYKLDKYPTQEVYLAYLADRIFGLSISRFTSDVLTVGGLLVGIMGCVWSWVREKRM